MPMPSSWRRNQAGILVKVVGDPLLVDMLVNTKGRYLRGSDSKNRCGQVEDSIILGI